MTSLDNAPARAHMLIMKSTKTSRVRSLETRIALLRAEMADPYTLGLGHAAVACVAESLRAAESELLRERGR